MVSYEWTLRWCRPIDVIYSVYGYVYHAHCTWEMGRLCLWGISFVSDKFRAVRSILHYELRITYLSFTKSYSYENKQKCKWNWVNWPWVDPEIDLSLVLPFDKMPSLSILSFPFSYHFLFCFECVGTSWTLWTSVYVKPERWRKWLEYENIDLPIINLINQPMKVFYSDFEESCTSQLQRL